MDISSAILLKLTISVAAATLKKKIKQLVYDLSQTYPDLKERIFGAMQRLPLPEWGPQGRYKRPKEQE